MTPLDISRDVTCHRLWRHNCFSNSIQFELIYLFQYEHHKIYLKSVLFSVSEKETNFSITPRIVTCNNREKNGILIITSEWHVFARRHGRLFTSPKATLCNANIGRHPSKRGDIKLPFRVKSPRLLFLRIDYFFRFLEVWMKKSTCTLNGGRSPPYENVHVVFFHSYPKETKNNQLPFLII